MVETRSDPVSLLFRYHLDERRRALFPPGSRVLEIRASGEAGEGPFDGAWAEPGALDGAESRPLARRLADALRPGAPLLICVRSPWPLPALLATALTGAGSPRGANGGGSPSLRELRAAFGPAFTWRGVFALGLLLPAPEDSAWVAENPQVFGLLAAAEGRLRGWPVLRGLGAFAVLEGVRA